MPHGHGSPPSGSWLPSWSEAWPQIRSGKRLQRSDSGWLVAPILGDPPPLNDSALKSSGHAGIRQGDEPLAPTGIQWCCVQANDSSCPGIRFPGHGRVLGALPKGRSCGVSRGVRLGGEPELGRRLVGARGVRTTCGRESWAIGQEEAEQLPGRARGQHGRHVGHADDLHGRRLSGRPSSASWWPRSMASSSSRRSCGSLGESAATRRTAPSAIRRRRQAGSSCHDFRCASAAACLPCLVATREHPACLIPDG